MRSEHVKKILENIYIIEVLSIAYDAFNGFYVTVLWFDAGPTDFKVLHVGLSRRSFYLTILNIKIVFWGKMYLS